MSDARHTRNFSKSNLMEELYKIQSLLDQVGTRIKHGEEIAREKGENFNIFKILNLETRENQTHSAFLKEMLDPKGSHDMGGVFLAHFLVQIRTKLSEDKISVLNAIKSEHCYVKTEHSIGQKDLIEKTGGRLDIFINYNNSHNIVIENKIYAADQEAQIERYCNFEKDKTFVFYVTLKGTEPIPNSKGSFESGKDFFLLSYETDIICWLEICMKEATEKPILRETIKQYIILLKKLTSQDMDKKNQEELIELLSRSANIGSAIKISENITRVKHRIVSIMAEKVAAKYSLFYRVSNDATGIVFFKKEWRSESGIWFAWDDGKTYYSIKTPEARVGKAIPQKRIDKLFKDKDSSPFNPFGYGYVLNDHWSNNPQLFIEMGDGSFADKTILPNLKNVLDYLIEHPEIENML